MKHQVLEPVGARVTELNLGTVQAGEVDRLAQLLAENGVVILPNQNIDDTDFLGFLAAFGELVFTEGETPVDGFQDLNVISNVGRETPPKSTFHVDTTYVPRPPAYTALRAVEVPEKGGQTLFSNQYAAYDSLSEETRTSIESRTATHIMTGLDGTHAASADHPLVRVHPMSGRKALYLSTPARIVSVSGMPDEHAAQMIRSLVDHSTREANLYRHSWSPGDVVMWDNRCVMHCADHNGVVGDRVMHRGMVAGSGK